jgi:hypothetical protein
MHTKDIFRRIFLSNYWWQKSDIWSQASYRYTILWVAFLDQSDSYFLFADLVGFYTHWTYMHIFRHIFLSNYWWQKTDIWSQASYRAPISWEAFLYPSDSYFLFADFVDFYTHSMYLIMIEHISRRAPDKLRICVFYAMKTSKNACIIRSECTHYAYILLCKQTFQIRNVLVQSCMNARHFGTRTIRHQDTSAPVWDISAPRQFGTGTIRHLCFFLWFYVQNFQLWKYNILIRQQ